ncbi:hypothetical protein N8I77_008618 [Diaporthe amygdali]|uniref:NAD(P)-binding domain-containing protein n=1 Tax=Phomopsis amygdali TaxID=1214568 RepID=A0AAD9S7Z4_PHOAM|nr:hypothetical protein N8I77_008618 [Diaporthe amygdali]KAK2602049.1 hypothetical protein N8I77_008618 [Diaporthe amygdali]KAK2602050.1 hypothetical protein N8I77_008618 [Diaporthe amygdali]KAK2602051.1 hypothetical protein N8I77_008618 [Diaporthe amygdali]
MPQILFIGGTGHVGGAVLHKILEQHPDDVQVKVLVRGEEKASRLVSKYPRVQAVLGDLTDYKILEEASSQADIVINAGPDITHNLGISAILRGLKARKEGSAGSQTPFYIHTSGASLIWDEPEGSKEAKWWDDIADIPELCSLEEKHTHAVTDRIVREGAKDVNVAIVSPGFVSGMSPSIEHPTPITTPAILTTARAFKSGFLIAQGENTHAWIHVMDLARIFMILVDDALATLAGKPIKRDADVLPLWGPEAYYFSTGEDISFADFMKGLVPVLKQHGVIESTETKSVNVTEAARISLAGPDGEYDPLAAPPPPDSWAMHIAIMYGVNMKIRGSRVEKLGWKPTSKVVDTFSEVVSEFLLREKRNA